MGWGERDRKRYGEIEESAAKKACRPQEHQNHSQHEKEKPCGEKEKVLGKAKKDSSRVTRRGGSTLKAAPEGAKHKKKGGRKDELTKEKGLPSQMGGECTQKTAQRGARNGSAGGPRGKKNDKRGE